MRDRQRSGCGPEVLLEEIDYLSGKGIAVGPQELKISEKAHLIMPYHKCIDAARENAASQNKKIGTTGRGIGPCYEDKANRCGIRFVDLLNARVFEEKVSAVCKEKNFYLTRYFSDDPVDADEIIKKYKVYQKRLAPYVTDIFRIHQSRDQKRKTGFV